VIPEQTMRVEFDKIRGKKIDPEGTMTAARLPERALGLAGRFAIFISDFGTLNVEGGLRFLALPNMFL